MTFQKKIRRLFFLESPAFLFNKTINQKENRNEVYGMLTVEELQQQVDSREIDTVLVVFTDLYGRFMGKRFDAEFFLEDAVETELTVVITW